MNKNLKYVPCTQCKQPIDVGDPGTYLARKGGLVRIRCREESCRNADWYSEAEFEATLPPPGRPVPDPGLSKTQWYDLLTSGY
jgi:hypothetical protein